jgi:periplasmic protein CpxP/Spy
MRNSIAPKKSCFGRGERKVLFASAFLAALLSLGVGAFAQDTQEAPPPPAAGQGTGQGMGQGMGRRSMESVDDQIKHLSKKLNLSADQQGKLKPILEDQRKQMEAIHSDSSLSREDRFSKMQTLRQSSDAQIKSVLTDDQQKSFDKMRADQQERMKQWHKGGDNAAPPAGASPNDQQ